MTNNPWKVVTLALGAVLIIVLVLFLFTRTAFGATLGLKLAENYDPYIRYNNGFYTNLPVGIGLNGTPINRENFNNCQIQAAANTIAATSTVTVDCVTTAGNPPGVALSGVTAGDIVGVFQSTTTPTLSEGLEVRGASASSTPGYITVLLFNGTGATFTWTATASTSFQYTDLH